MSRKSRQRKGEAAAEAAGIQLHQSVPVATATVETTRPGLPFGIVVLFAAVMSIPTILQMADETMSFDAGIVRLLVALAVAWLLSYLVHAVIDAMRPDVEEVDVTVETPPADLPGYPEAGGVPPYPTVGDDDVSYPPTGT